MDELDRGAAFTASDDEVDEAIANVAEELGEPEEKVRENVEYIMDQGEGVSTSFNESVSGASLEHDEVGSGDPRLEALEIYRLRKKI